MSLFGNNRNCNSRQASYHGHRQVQSTKERDCLYREKEDLEDDDFDTKTIGKEWEFGWWQLLIGWIVVALLSWVVARLGKKSSFLLLREYKRFLPIIACQYMMSGRVRVSLIGVPDCKYGFLYFPQFISVSLVFFLFCFFNILNFNNLFNFFLFSIKKTCYVVMDKLISLNVVIITQVIAKHHIVHLK